MDATGNDDSESYFAAARPPNGRGLDDTVKELKLLQQNLILEHSLILLLARLLAAHWLVVMYMSDRKELHMQARRTGESP